MRNTPFCFALHPLRCYATPYVQSVCLWACTMSLSVEEALWNTSNQMLLQSHRWECTSW